MGQLSYPDGCPICGGLNGGRGTCDPCGKTVDQFRRLIRNLQQWRSSYEVNPELEILPSVDGREWNIWDVERFYGYRRLLPEQQRRCIELFLHDNFFERETAQALGVGRGKHTSVAIYATVGLIKLLAMARAGELPGCHFDFEVDLPPRHVAIPIPIVPAPAHIELPEPMVTPIITVQVTYTLDGAPLVLDYPLLSPVEASP